LFTALTDGKRQVVEIVTAYHAIGFVEYKALLRLCWALIVGCNREAGVCDGFIPHSAFGARDCSDNYVRNILYNLRREIKPWRVAENDCFGRIKLLADPGAVVVNSGVGDMPDEEIKAMVRGIAWRRRMGLVQKDLEVY
jgi:hypothetical protein